MSTSDMLTSATHSYYVFRKALWEVYHKYGKSRLIKQVKWV